MLSDFQAVQVLLGQVVAESVLLLKRVKILSQRYFPDQHEIFGMNHRLDLPHNPEVILWLNTELEFLVDSLFLHLFVNLCYKISLSTKSQCVRQNKQGTDPTKTWFLQGYAA